MSEPSARQRFEQAHADWLAPYAVAEADAGARLHPEPEHPYRTIFQRDRDRIVHCSAFRRLDFKTQVFVPHEHDHFRTRLTHTLEVAQIGRTIGRALRLNEDLIEAVALAHDLGHPPFGHRGEWALNDLMTDAGGFEHNRHSLRIVDYLEHPYPQFRGLNLSRVVRECLAKHETRYDTPVSSEFDPAEAAPLEGQVVDLADEVAYTAADLDDALAAGWLTVEDLSELAIWRDAWAQAEKLTPDARPIHRRIRARAAILSEMVDDVIATTAARVEGAQPSLADVRQAGEKWVGMSEPMVPRVSQLQAFLLERVYNHPTSLAHGDRAAAMIKDLFEHFTHEPEAIPKRYLGRVDSDGLPGVIRDYIAGMTDRFCRSTHADLCG